MGPGNSLAVQWLGLGAFTTMGLGSIPGWGTKIPQAKWRREKKTQTSKQKKPVWVLYGFILLCKLYVFWEDNVGEIQNQVIAIDL